MRGILSKTTVVFILATICMMTVAVTAYAQSEICFSDVTPEDWFYNEVSFAAAHSLINGYPDGSFRPNQPITYGQIITILCRMKGVTYGDDLEADYMKYAREQHWYSLIELLPSQGGETASRKVAARIILSAAGIQPYAYEMYHDESFRDFDQITHIHGVDYQDYVYAAFCLGLFSGDESRNFHPEAFMTRAEFCRASTNKKWKSSPGTLGARNFHSKRS